jgi:hypothetical protein
MNKLTLTLTILISVGLGYWAGINHQNECDDTRPKAPSHLAPTLTPTKTKAAPVSAEKEVSERDLAALAQTPPAAKLQSADSVTPTAQQQLDALKAEQEFNRRTEKFSAWLVKSKQENPWFDLRLEMRQRFETEDVDHRWASTEEARLQNLFSEHQALAGLAVKATTCKSTQCKITVGVVDANHANEAAQVISKVLGENRHSHVIIDNQAQQGDTFLYVPRNEEGFDFN